MKFNLDKIEDEIYNVIILVLFMILIVSVLSFIWHLLCFITILIQINWVLSISILGPALLYLVYIPIRK
jgi:cell division septal protein FtsQ